MEYLKPVWGNFLSYVFFTSQVNYIQLCCLQAIDMQNLPPEVSESKVLGDLRQTTGVLSIAGFDPSSGAGLTADLKTFAAHGLYGLACPTALTVQSTQGVRRSEAVDRALIAETLDCLREDIAIAGVKIGMLAGAPAVGAVVSWLRRFRAEQPNFPVVLDPVLRSSSGAELLSDGGVQLLKTELLPLVSVVTPNLAEAAVFTGLPVATRVEAELAARALQANVPGMAVVVTGGDAGGSPDDFLLDAHGAGCWFPGRRVQTRSTHGTGCAFSSALLANLVLGQALPDAVGSAKEYVRKALLHAYPVGKGRGPMHHLFALGRRP